MKSDIDMPRKFTNLAAFFFSILVPWIIRKTGHFRKVYAKKFLRSFIMILPHKPERCWKTHLFSVHSRHGFGQWFGLWHQFDICSLAVNPTKNFPQMDRGSEGCKRRWESAANFIDHGAFKHLVTGMISPSSLLEVVSFGFFFRNDPMLMNDRIFCWYHVVVDVLDV